MASGRANTEADFWLKVDKDAFNGCWVWTGYLMPTGYGRFRMRRMFLAHRFAYMALIGPIPEGLDLDHLCHNKRCVNPAHLEPVTRTTNVQRSWEIRSLVTHCKRGHPYEGDNLYVSRFGRRGCKACRQLASCAHYQRRKANHQ